MTARPTFGHEEFGHADLGDARRVRRLVSIADESVRRPGGTVAATIKSGARLEAAFRFVENDAVPWDAIGRASSEACARRCASERFVVVPVDQSSLSLPDDARKSGFGSVGRRSYGRIGIHVMTALALDRACVPIGVLAQDWWVRGPEPPADRCGGSKHDKRRREDRESYSWVRTLRASAERLREAAPQTTPWFQLDRGGDCLQVLTLAEDEGLLVTIRAARERRLRWPDGREPYLFETMNKQPVVGWYEIEVPQRTDQVARRARLAVRIARLPLLLKVGASARRVVYVNVILASEIDAPHGQKPLRWMLFTNRPVVTLDDAVAVVEGYTSRWRIEEFHKTWKSGACGIEFSRLRARDHFLRWATIMAAVAARIERIKHLARQEPERPATEAFTREEIDAAILIRRSEAVKVKVPYAPGDTPSVAEVTRWIAQMGGYLGSKRSPPPGATVLRRGLEYVSTMAKALRAIREAEKSG